MLYRVLGGKKKIPILNSFLFFLYNSITLLFLLKSKTDSTINPNPNPNHGRFPLFFLHLAHVDHTSHPTSFYLH